MGGSAPEGGANLSSRVQYFDRVNCNGLSDTENEPQHATSTGKKVSTAVESGNSVGVWLRLWRDVVDG